MHYFIEKVGDKLKILENREYIEKLYVMLGISIFIHYGLVIFFALLILLDIFLSGRYREILKDKSLIIIQLVLGFSVVMSLVYRNYYGLIAIPILFCLMVGRYYTLKIDRNFKRDNLELLTKISGIAAIPRLAEFLLMSKKQSGSWLDFSSEYRIGYWLDHNPNYLGNIMLMMAVTNLYFMFRKRSAKHLMLFLLNVLMILLSGSRSTLAALSIGIFVLLFYFIERKYFIAILSLFLFYIYGTIFWSFPFLRKDTLIEYFWLRVDIIEIALTIFRKTNFLYGHGNFYYYKFTKHVYPHSHNIFVESLLSYGLIGTLALGGVFLKYIYDIVRDSRNNVLKVALILSVLSHNFTDFVIFWIQTVLLFIIILSYDENEGSQANHKQA